MTRTLTSMAPTTITPIPPITPITSILPAAAIADPAARTATCLNWTLTYLAMAAVLPLHPLVREAVLLTVAVVVTVGAEKMTTSST